MPTGVSRSPWTRPHLQSVLARRLPEGEVAGMALARVRLAASARHQLRGRVARKPPVRGEASDVEVDGSADLVRVLLLDQDGDQLDHLPDVLRRTWIRVRGPDVELPDVVHEGGGVVRRDLFRRFVLQARRHQHLVFAAVECVIGQVADVGDVHDLLGPVAEVLEAAPEQVGQHEGAQVADVDVPVDGGPTRVDPHHALLERAKFVLRSRERVVEADRGQAHAVSILSIDARDSP